MAIPIILRQISYSFNTNILLVNFVFLGKKMGKGRGGEGQHRPISPPPSWIRHLGPGKCSPGKILKIKLPGMAISCVFSDQIWHQMRACAVQAE